MAERTSDIRVTSRLLLTAALIDLMLIVILMKLLAPIMAAEFILDERIAHLWSIAGLVLGHWIVTELLLGGRSVGRFCLGLRCRMQDGRRPDTTTLVKRAVFKFLTLGIGGVPIDRPTQYDRSVGVVWQSDLALVRRSGKRGRRGSGGTRSKPWRLRVANGPDAGAALTIGHLQPGGPPVNIKIGRDPAWSDLVLARSQRVSSYHCILRIGPGGAEVRDYGTEARGSSNGTWIAGRKISHTDWHRLGSDLKFTVADVAVFLQR
ncbi:MAG: FHA domain-containing protein [Pseudomonadota bacterium]